MIRFSLIISSLCLLAGQGFAKPVQAPSGKLPTKNFQVMPSMMPKKIFVLMINNWTTITPLAYECVKFGGPESSQGVTSWQVHEFHSPKCGGDPKVEPLVTVIKLTVKNAQVSYAKLVNGLYQDFTLK